MPLGRCCRAGLASSLCLGWPAEDPKFDIARARLLVDRYRQVRHLFNADWYALTPYSLAPDAWLGVQFDAPASHEGAILVFRREQSPRSELRVALRGLDLGSNYELTWQSTGRKETVPEELLRDGYPICLPEKRSSALTVYRRQNAAP